MSTWTHVAGVIRVDALRGITKTPDFEKIFISLTWEHDNKDCNMPMGSEGSLEYKVLENPNPDCLAAYNIIIWGDLRDFGVAEIQDIKEWWDRVLKECGWVRQAILQVQPGDGDRVILNYEEDNQ